MNQVAVVYQGQENDAGFDGDAAGFGDAASSQTVKSVERVYWFARFCWFCYDSKLQMARQVPWKMQVRFVCGMLLVAGLWLF